VPAGVEPLAVAVLSRFRLDFHTCLTARTDELSDLADAQEHHQVHITPWRGAPGLRDQRAFAEWKLG